MAASFITFNKAEQGSSRPVKCQLCQMGVKNGQTVLYMRLGSAVPFDLRDHYIHAGCLKLAAEIAEVDLAPAPVQDINEVIDGMRELVAHFSEVHV